MNNKTLAVLVAVAAIGLAACDTEVEKAHKLAAKLDDAREAADIVNASVARPISCALAARNAFDPNTDKARFWFYRRDDGRLECFDSPGYHRTSRAPLHPITTFEVDEIKSNPSCYPPPTPCPPPPPAPAPAAPTTPKSLPQLGEGKISDIASTPTASAAAPTPLPELGEGPCCGR